MTQSSFLPLVFMCGIALFGAAATSATVSAQTPATPAAVQIAAPAGASSDAAYRLDVGDAIEIRFFFNQELNESVQIRPDGFIAMPLVGDVRAQGQTPSALADDLASRYRGVLKQPAVTVQVRSFANRRVFIGGEVAKPGVLPLVGVQTALGAITEAGGLTQRAVRGHILLLRRGPDGTPETRRISLKAQAGQAPEAASLQLQPLDVVLVTESAIAKTNRAVDQYVRQLVPGLLTFGFTYLANDTVAGAIR